MGHSDIGHCVGGQEQLPAEQLVCEEGNDGEEPGVGAEVGREQHYRCRGCDQQESEQEAGLQRFLPVVLDAVDEELEVLHLDTLIPGG